MASVYGKRVKAAATAQPIVVVLLRACAEAAAGAGSASLTVGVISLERRTARTVRMIANARVANNVAPKGNASSRKKI